MPPCSSCGARERLLQTATRQSFVIIGEGLLDPYLSTVSRSIECASCGATLSHQRHELPPLAGLDAPVGAAPRSTWLD